jgi:hypothetical protein
MHIASARGATHRGAGTTKAANTNNNSNSSNLVLSIGSRSPTPSEQISIESIPETCRKLDPIAAPAPQSQKAGRTHGEGRGSQTQSRVHTPCAATLAVPRRALLVAAIHRELNNGPPLDAICSSHSACAALEGLCCPTVDSV